MKIWRVFGILGLMMIISLVEGFEDGNVTNMDYVKSMGFNNRPLMVGLTLVYGAAAKGAGISSSSSHSYLFCSFFFLHLFFSSNRLF